MSVALDVDGPAAPPRRNGELAFDAPWEARVFGLAAAVVDEHLGGDWQPFRRLLIAAIAAEPDRPYWHSWTLALEQLTVDVGILDAGAVDAQVEAQVEATT